MVLPRQANLGYGYRLKSDAHQTGFGHNNALCSLPLSVDRRENKGFVVKNRLDALKVASVSDLD
ncbi:hypothetical protein [Nostoc sp.]|uniref:hypothetical protein n=1 Tax=Nostoc sp. TaxID=1180 RepID=UPI003FA614A7